VGAFLRVCSSGVVHHPPRVGRVVHLGVLDDHSGGLPLAYRRRTALGAHQVGHAGQLPGARNGSPVVALRSGVLRHCARPVRHLVPEAAHPVLLVGRTCHRWVEPIDHLAFHRYGAAGRFRVGLHGGHQPGVDAPHDHPTWLSGHADRCFQCGCFLWKDLIQSRLGGRRALWENGDYLNGRSCMVG